MGFLAVMIKPTKGRLMTASVFDKLCDEYWQQFCQNVAVGGGMAYQNRLNDCVLDESLESLKRVDKLLIAVKQDILHKGYPENALLKQTSVRNFIFFVAFYVGKVIQKHTQNPLSWQSVSLDNIRPQDKFYTLMAFGKPAIFVLMTIGAKLFGRLDRPFYHPISRELIEDSVYWLAYEAIYATGDTPILDIEFSAKETDYTLSIIDSDTAVTDQKTAKQFPAKQKTTEQKPIGQKTAKSSTSQPNSEHLAKQQNTQIAQNLSAQSTNHKNKSDLDIHKSPSTPHKAILNKTTPYKTTQNGYIDNQNPSLTLNQNASPNNATSKNSHSPSHFAKRSTKKPKPQADFFAEVKQDLTILPAVNDTNQANFVKAYDFLQKIPTQDELSDAQKKGQLKAVRLIADTAKTGNTNAMIVLAICYFNGIGVAKDENKGFAIVQKTADMHDVRAQKLLSRLYYQGLGTTANMQLGEFWLQKSADNGHENAKKLVAQFAQNRLILDDFRVESQKDKRYFTMLAIVAVAGVIGLWLVGKILAS